MSSAFKVAATEIDTPMFQFTDITNPRELWILEQLCKGKLLKRQDIEKEFSLSPNSPLKKSS